MKNFGRLVLSVSMLALSACSAIDSYSEVDTLNSIEARGSAFTRELSEQYRLYANDQLNVHYDYPDALHFARKGLATAAGETVLPEPVTDWNLDEYHSKMLGQARNRMIIAFDHGAREALPQLSARAQAKFDCWIEVQEEYWTDQGASECQGDFFSLIEEIETHLQPVNPKMVDNVEPAEEIAVPDIAPVEEEIVEPAFNSEVFNINPQEPMAVENAMYLIFFNWDSAKIGSGAMSIVDAIVGEVNKSSPNVVNIVGHTDTSGPTAYNQRLAVKRAKATKDELIKKGVNPTLITLDAKGESDLLVPTPDSVREPANRRVNISFE